MAFLIATLTLVLIGLVVLVVGAPLRRARRMGNGASGPTARPGAAGAASPARARAELEATHEQLEAAREAKYREIRDTELDYRTGKLSQEDYEAIDADLRAEALEILDRVERLSPREP